MKPHIIKNKYVVGNKLGRGKFGIVYEGISLKNNNTIAIKYADDDGGLVKHEAVILNYLYRKSVKHVPFVIWYGIDTLPTTNKQVLCLIMPKYDCSLTEYLAMTMPTCQRTNQIEKMMANSIYIFKSIHKQFIIHRDVKPDNFMVKDGIVYLIDFGLSQSFIDETGEHNKQKYGDSILGTPLFISPNIHNGSNPSRRDDLISLGYIFLKLFNGVLIWENVYSSDYSGDSGVLYNGLININHLNNKRLYNIKKNIEYIENNIIIPIPRNGINCDFKKKIIRFIKYCYSLDYGDEPEYNICIDDFYAD